MQEMALARLALSANDHASDEVRAIARLELQELKRWVYAPLPAIKDQAHIAFASWQIEQFEKDPKQISVTPQLSLLTGHPLERTTMGMAGNDFSAG